MNEIEDEVSMEECRTLILSSKNDELNSYCNYVCASNYEMSFVLMPKEELFINNQWARQFGKEMDAHENQANHWDKKWKNNATIQMN